MISYTPAVDLYLRYFGYPHTVAESAPGFAFWGANSLIFRSPDFTLLIDPYFSRLPGLLGLPYVTRRIRPDAANVRRFLQMADVIEADVVLLTHTHFDHILDAYVIAAETGALLAGPPLLARLRPAQYHALPFEILAPHQPLQISGFTISHFPTKHLPLPPFVHKIDKLAGKLIGKNEFPLYAWEYETEGAEAYLLENNGHSFFIMGSAGLPLQPLPVKPVDVMILSIGGLDMLSHLYLDEFLTCTVDVLQPKYLLLSHWDDFTKPLTEPISWLGQANRSIDRILHRYHDSGVSCFLLPVGKNLEFPV